MLRPPSVAAVLAFSLAAPFSAVADKPAVTSASDGYMVVPFENHSNVKSLDWMSTALPVTLAEKLEAHPSLRPVYGASILDGLDLPLDEAAVAARAADYGARWVFGGAFSRPNWKAEVTVRLYEVVGAEPPSLRPVAELSARGERTALFNVLDEAMLGVLALANLAVDGDYLLAAMKRSPTHDLYAFTLYGRGLNLFYGISGKTDEPVAQKTLSRVTLIDPKFAEAHRMLGVVYLARGETSKAAGQYAHALDLKPGYFAAIVGLARLYRAENKSRQAEEMAGRALDIRAGDEEMRFLLGQLEWEAGEFDKALADLLKVTSEHPHHVGARRALVQVYASKGDTASLAAELEQLSELVPEDADVRLDLAAAYMRLGKTDRALAVLDEILKRKPRHVQALKLSGDLYRKIGAPARAVAVYEKMRRVSPDDPRSYFLLGAAYSEAGNDLKAEQILEEAAQFHRYLGEVWIDLGAIAYRRGEMNRATNFLQKAVARVPHRPKAHFNYALVLNATNQRDKALSELRWAADLDPEDPDVHYLAGVIYLRLGKLDDAKLEFAQAVKIKPDHPDAQHNLALLEDLEKRYGTEKAGTGAQ